MTSLLGTAGTDPELTVSPLRGTGCATSPGRGLLPACWLSLSGLPALPRPCGQPLWHVSLDGVWFLGGPYVTDPSIVALTELCELMVTQAGSSV